MPVRLGICLNLSRSADYSYAGFTKGRTLLGSLSSRAQQADSLANRLAKSRDPVFSSSKICGEPAQRQPSALKPPSSRATAARLKPSPSASLTSDDSVSWALSPQPWPAQSAPDSAVGMAFSPGKSAPVPGKCQDPSATRPGCRQNKNCGWECRRSPCSAWDRWLH